SGVHHPLWGVTKLSAAGNRLKAPFACGGFSAGTGTEALHDLALRAGIFHLRRGCEGVRGRREFLREPWVRRGLPANSDGDRAVGFKGATVGAGKADPTGNERCDGRTVSF